MPAKISTHVFKGMQKDINVANSSNEYLFDAHNIRFNQLDDNTLMSIVNERGNECILESGIEGQYVSHYVIGNHIVVFTYDETNELNIIYRIDVDEPNVTVHTLFDESDLNIRPKKPLEFTSYFEAEGVIKIYWVDGVNQLRFMNIMVDEPYTDPNDFNTTPELKLEEVVTVEQIEGNGQFPAGVIKYALTYVNKLGAESNIFYITKLHSIQYPTRAASPQEYINCAFRITINNVDTGFDYIRCYQLLRTSLDAQPTCLLLNEVAVDSTITLIDINEGSTYDPTSLLFPKYPIIPQTLDQKNNTLFLGNLDEDVFKIPNTEISKIRNYFNKISHYTNAELDAIRNLPDDQQGVPGDYPLNILRFENASANAYRLNDSGTYVYNYDCDIIRTFKNNEIYRIGVIFQDNFGVWSEPIFLRDIEVDCFQQREEDYVIPVSLIFDTRKADDFPEIELPNNRELKRFKLVMVNPTVADRKIYSQGIIIPTMYEVGDRCNNQPFNYNSWYLRPFGGKIEYRHNVSVPTGGQLLQAELQGGNTIKWFETTGQPSSSEDSIMLSPKLIVNITSLYGIYQAMTHGVDFSFTITVVNEGTVFDYEPIQKRHIMFVETVNTDSKGDLKQSDRIALVQKMADALSEDNISSMFKYIETNYTVQQIQSDLQTEILKKVNNVWKHKLADYSVSGAINSSISITLPSMDFQDFVISSTQTSEYESGTTCNFRVDHSVLNLYSPDIDSNYYNINNTQLDLRIVGYSQINRIQDSVFLELESSGASYKSKVKNVLNNSILNLKLYDSNSKNNIFEDTLVFYDYSNNSSGTSDGTVKIKRSFVNENRLGTADKLYNYVVYPWHSAGSLNNEDNTEGENRSAKYSKIFAKQFVSNKTEYFNVPYLYNDEDGNPCSVGTLRVCNNTNKLVTFIQNGQLRSYMPNVDIARTLISTTPNDTSNPPIYLYKEGNYTVITPAIEQELYDIIDNISSSTSNNYKVIKNFKDPIQIKYNSDTHVLIPINRNIEYVNSEEIHKLYKIPTFDVITYPAQEDWNPGGIVTFPYNSKYYPVWDTKAYQDVDNYISNVDYDGIYFYIGEIYNSNAIYPYGGPITTGDESILYYNVFIPVMESEQIEVLQSKQELIATTYGDTWYGRWDCLKTQRMTDQDQQSVQDYASVMIESHINLNGRYDSYRNFYDQTLVNAQNANKFNDVYNQMDTFWLYKITPNYLKTTYYPNQITWSLTKQTGSLVDEWTKVTAANIEQLDGNKGSINKILNYKDNLFVFQDRCISQIKYNEQTQMTTTEGVSVEISNSQKVTGVVKVYDGTGCINKWSIASDANGIFFVDNINECIIWLGGSQDTPIVNLTNSKAFTQFMKANNSFDVWNPEDFSNFVTFIDSAHKDVYFVNVDKCLCFSLVLQEFTSFYDYQGTYGMFNINNNFYSLYDKNGLKLYRNFTGKYNEIYGELVDTSFTFIDHGESFLTDKTFTNINYIQDAYCIQQYDEDEGVWIPTKDALSGYKDDYDDVDYKYESEITFSTLRVWTPFQDTGDITLTPNEDLQRKFRTWGIQISRDLKYNNTSVDRIRNNWAKFKFTFTQPDYGNKDIKIELMNINIQSIE